MCTNTYKTMMINIGETSMINISGIEKVDDPNYRYKMPAVRGRFGGSGGGIHTTIPNIAGVALALNRDPGEVAQFIGTVLGADANLFAIVAADTTTMDHGHHDQQQHAIVGGMHTDRVLQDVVHYYIEKFVLCLNCRLPETDYSIESECIYHKCRACGAKEMIDMHHKLCTYILSQDIT